MKDNITLRLLVVKNILRGEKRFPLHCLHELWNNIGKSLFSVSPKSESGASHMPAAESDLITSDSPYDLGMDLSTMSPLEFQIIILEGFKLVCGRGLTSEMVLGAQAISPTMVKLITVQCFSMGTDLYP